MFGLIFSQRQAQRERETSWDATSVYLSVAQRSGRLAKFVMLQMSPNCKRLNAGVI